MANTTSSVSNNRTASVGNSKASLPELTLAQTVARISALLNRNEIRDPLVFPEDAGKTLAKALTNPVPYYRKHARSAFDERGRLVPEFRNLARTYFTGGKAPLDEKQVATIITAVISRNGPSDGLAQKIANALVAGKADDLTAPQAFEDFVGSPREASCATRAREAQSSEFHPSIIHEVVSIQSRDSRYTLDISRAADGRFTFRSVGLGWNKREEKTEAEVTQLESELNRIDTDPDIGITINEDGPGFRQSDLLSALKQARALHRPKKAEDTSVPAPDKQASALHQLQEAGTAVPAPDLLGQPTVVGLAKPVEGERQFWVLRYPDSKDGKLRLEFVIGEPGTGGKSLTLEDLEAASAGDAPEITLDGTSFDKNAILAVIRAALANAKGK